METLGRVLSTLFKSLTQLIPRSVTDSIDSVVDFAYARLFGLPFIVLGYRQTGKTTLLEWLRHDAAFLAEFNPDPTTAGGEPVPAFTTRLGADGGALRLRPRRDVGGEYSMWDTDWAELFRQTKPRGIIFLIDHTNPVQHKDALNFVLQMLDDEEAARKPLRMFTLLINKKDLWGEDVTVESILENYRNETRRLKSQAARLGYRYAIRSTSLMTGEGVREAMIDFFDAIRPRSQQTGQPRPAAEGIGV
jgi:GTPase SAR1 family protein